MRRLYVPLTLLLVAGLALAFSYAPRGDASAVTGVWKVVEVTVTNDEGTTTNEVTQPNLTIFTEGHYASLNVFGQEPRAELPEDPTDEQLVAAWQPFNANAGTYEISGSEIATTVIVAKSPNATANANTNSNPFEVDGDTMYRTFTNQAGTVFRVKYMRVE